MWIVSRRVIRAEAYPGVDRVVWVLSNRSSKSVFMLRSFGGTVYLSVFAFLRKTMHIISPLLGELGRLHFHVFNESLTWGG